MSESKKRLDAIQVAMSAVKDLLTREKFDAPPNTGRYS